MTSSSFCASCGSAREGDARFCTDCGETFVDPFARPAESAGAEPAQPLRDAEPRLRATPPPPYEEPATAQMPAAEAGYGYGAPPPPPMGPGGYAPGPPMDPSYGTAMAPQGHYYPQAPQQPAASSNRGLVIGLSAALVAVVAGALVAVLLMTSGGSDTTPTLAASPTPAAAASQTVTTVTEAAPTPAPKPKKKKRRSQTSSSAGSAGTPASVPLPTPSVAAPAPKPAGPSPKTVAKAQMRNVVEQHWSDIQSGAYNSAFTALMPTQSQSAWVAAHEEDALTSASITLGSPTLDSDTTATLPVDYLRTDAASGCFTWSGYYRMQKFNGSWRIEKSKLNRTPC